MDAAVDLARLARNLPLDCERLAAGRRPVSGGHAPNEVRRELVALSDRERVRGVWSSGAARSWSK